MGCRAAVPQAELVRVAVTAGRVVADPRRRVPGRGAYVHARPACLTAAGKGGLARSLKRAVSRAEVDGLVRALAPAGDGAVTAGGGRPVTGAPADPGVFPPGQAGADAVEIGSPSTRNMPKPRHHLLANATHHAEEPRVLPVGPAAAVGAERSRQEPEAPGDATAEPITEQ
ncbi:MAG TPA: YlxR family protein [Kofleriaceae bacterium]|nr:YlxR family protein [Kofleriaceae bacterium]